MSNFLFLDIDGVLAPVNLHSVPERHWAWPDWQLVDPARAWREKYSPSMVAALNQLIAEHELTVIISSSWEDTGPEFCHRIGLVGAQSWTWLDTSDRENQWGKHRSVAAATRVMGKEHNYAWLDDDLAHEHEAALWAASNNVLAIPTHESHGISPAVLKQLANHFSR